MVHCGTALPSAAPWHVIRARARQEVRAEQNLQSGGIEVFLPRTRGSRLNVRCRSIKVMPLFPQYLFARFDLSRARDVAFTRGIQTIVRAGNNFAVVDDGIITLLKGRMDAEGLIRVGEPLQPGEKVLIEDGPFSSLTAVVERVLPHKDRVSILLSTINAPFRITIAAAGVRRFCTTTAYGRP